MRGEEKLLRVEKKREWMMEENGKVMKRGRKERGAED